MPIQDHAVDWIRKRHYFDASSFFRWNQMAETTGGGGETTAHGLAATPNIVGHGVSENDGTALDVAYGTHTATNVVSTMTDSALKAIFSAAVERTEFGTLGWGGVHIQTAGDTHYCISRVPYDVDPSHALGFRVHYIGAAAVADIFDWIMLLDFKAAGAACVAPTTALDTVIDVTGTKAAVANAHDWSSRGVKNAEFLTRDQIEDGAAMMFSIELDSTASTLASEECHLLGVEMDYVPLMTRGPGNPNDRMLTATGAT